MKVDGVGGDFFGGHGEVAFVFAILVVDEDDHAPWRISSTASSTVANGEPASVIAGFSSLN